MCERVSDAELAMLTAEQMMMCDYSAARGAPERMLQCERKILLVLQETQEWRAQRCETCGWCHVAIQHLTKTDTSELRTCLRAKDENGFYEPVTKSSGCTWWKTKGAQ